MIAGSVLWVTDARRDYTPGVTFPAAHLEYSNSSNNATLALPNMFSYTI